MREAPYLEIYVARWRPILGSVWALWFMTLGVFFVWQDAAYGAILLTGVAFALLGAAILWHCIRVLRSNRPSLVVTETHVWHEGWAAGSLPLARVRKVWISERAEEGPRLNFELEAEPGAVALGRRDDGAMLCVNLAALYVPMGREELRQDIAFRALRARAGADGRTGCGMAA